MTHTRPGAALPHELKLIRYVGSRRNAGSVVLVMTAAADPAEAGASVRYFTTISVRVERDATLAIEIGLIHTPRLTLAAILRTNGRTMDVLVVDVGGTHVKILATGKKEKREFASGPRLTAPQMVSRVKNLAQDWKYQVSIGYPGPVLHNRPVAEPRNLANGWMGFNFEQAFKRPTKIINDAAMQALGSYKRRKDVVPRPRNGVWVRRLLRTVFWSLWSSVICRTRKAHTRITSARGGCGSLAKGDGGNT